MIDETVTGHRSGRHIWLFWMLAAAALIVGNLAMRENHLLVFALAPLVVGVVTLVTRKELLVVRFDEAGIEVLEPSLEFIPYDSIEAMTVGYEHGRDFSIAVLHRHGALNLPADMDADSDRVFRFLRRELPEEESIGPPVALKPFVEAQDVEFGKKRVGVYRALAAPRFRKSLALVFASAALFVVGIIWIIIGDHWADYRGWQVAGFFACFGSAITFIVALSTRGSGSRPAGDGGLIVAPTGLAVQQGDLLGRMRWDEITRIDMSRMNRSIFIHFTGGMLTLPDLFHRPNGLIYRRLMDYWEGPVDDRY